MRGGIVENVGRRSLKDTHPTCGFCQAICVADPKQRKELFSLLKSSGMMFVDDECREYIKRTDEAGKEVIYYPPSEEDYYQKKK